jgi:light-regulated signal transduction histidine kinase (bacteriophytochrome)
MVLQMTSLNSLVENVLRDLEPEITGRKIDWRVGSLPSVNCDPGLIQQVFANLLSNAVKYTRQRERAVIEIEQSTIEGQLVIFVRDNGAGFDPKYSAKLFGTFQRLHSDQEFEGTGVGLATVQRIVRKHGGRIWAEAETNKGATFYFSLSEAASMSGAVNRHAAGK